MIVVVTIVLGIVVMTVAAVVVLAVRLRREAGHLSHTMTAVSERVGAVADELTDEIAVMEVELEHVQTSLDRLGESRRSRSGS